MKRAAIALGVILAWACIAGGMDRHDAEITAQIERDTRAQVETFTLPIEYTATVSQCGKDGCKTRYYYPRAK